MYDRILVAIDPTPPEENWSALQQTEQIASLTGGHFRVHVARRDVVPEGISAGSGLGNTLCAT
jgi:uncharacterized protein YndB with AHSA1/START domain